MYVYICIHIVNNWWQHWSSVCTIHGGTLYNNCNLLVKPRCYNKWLFNLLEYHQVVPKFRSKLILTSVCVGGYVHMLLRQMAVCWNIASVYIVLINCTGLSLDCWALQPWCIRRLGNRFTYTCTFQISFDKIVFINMISFIIQYARCFPTNYFSHIYIYSLCLCVFWSWIVP